MPQRYRVLEQFAILCYDSVNSFRMNLSDVFASTRVLTIDQFTAQQRTREHLHT